MVSLSRDSIAFLALTLFLIAALLGDGYFVFLRGATTSNSITGTSLNKITAANSSSVSTVSELVPTTITSSLTITETSTTAIYVPCNNTELDSEGGAFLSAPQNGTIVLCVLFYYYNQTAYQYFDPGSNDFLSISRFVLNGTQIANSDFSISVTPGGALPMGGPGDANEGSLEVYYITANPNVSGIFELNLADGNYYGNSGLNGGIVIDHQTCSPFTLTVGNATMPDVVSDGGPSSCMQTQIYPTVFGHGETPLPEGIIMANVIGFTSAGS